MAGGRQSYEPVGEGEATASERPLCLWRLGRVAMLSIGALLAVACVSTAGSVTPMLAARLRGMIGADEEAGICQEGKEYWWGLCYPQCSYLTDGEYPHRAGACKCCKDDGVCSEPSRYLHSCENFSAAPTEPIGYPALTVPGDCADDEELFSAACYTKCRDLAPEFPYRIGACHCCNSPLSTSCAKTPENYVANCSLLGVARNTLKTVHPPIALCDTAEDFFGGLCYDKCSIVTADAYVIRAGACKCCSEWPCTDPSTYIEDCEKFNKGVGGEAPHLPPFIDPLEGGTLLKDD